MLRHSNNGTDTREFPGGPHASKWASKDRKGRQAQNSGSGDSELSSQDFTVANPAGGGYSIAARDYPPDF
jgi:hypothetical protein